MKILATAASLLALTACFEVEQTVDLRGDGGIDHELRLGLPARPVAQLGASRVVRWVEDARQGALGPGVTVDVQQDADTVWYEVDATLPDLSAYQGYREKFVATVSARSDRPSPWLLPPEISDEGGQRVVRFAVEAVPAGENPPPTPSGEGQGRLTLTVRGADIGANNADRVEAGALVWERPLGDLFREGLDARAVFGRPSKAWLWGLVGAAIVGIGLVFVGRRGAA